jgi:hypothetical protein
MLFVINSLIFCFCVSTQDAMDALNGRSYDGRDLRITVDAGRPAGGGGGGGRGSVFLKIYLPAPGGRFFHNLSRE